MALVRKEHPNDGRIQSFEHEQGILEDYCQNEEVPNDEQQTSGSLQDGEELSDMEVEYEVNNQDSKIKQTEIAEDTYPIDSNDEQKNPNEEVKELICGKSDELYSKMDDLEIKINEWMSKIEEESESDQENVTEQLIKELAEKVEIVAKNQDRNDKQIAQTLRENANFQVQVRQGMQKELEDYRKIDRKEVFTPVLSDLATTYVDYKLNLEQKIDELFVGKEYTKDEILTQVLQIQHLIKNMFDEIQEILEENGAEIVKSIPGDTRRARQCKIMRKIPTGDRNLHNTIVRSTRDGVILGRQVLCNEYVDVYVYDESLSNDAEDDEGKETENIGEDHNNSSKEITLNNNNDNFQNEDYDRGKQDDFVDFDSNV